MKRLLVFGSLFLSCTVRGANVLWNEGFSFSKAVFGDVDVGGYSLTLNLLASEDIYCDFIMKVEDFGGGWKRRILGYAMDAGRESWYVIADIGDEINAETTKDPSKVFFSNAQPSSEDNIKPEYYGNEPWTLYLGLETTFNGSWDQDGTVVKPMRKVYGWLELFVDDYTLTLGNTCLDLSGRPVVVGVRPEEPIPEPGAGSLALCGVALLFRPRRR